MRVWGSVNNSGVRIRVVGSVPVTLKGFFRIAIEFAREVMKGCNRQAAVVVEGLPFLFAFAEFKAVISAAPLLPIRKVVAIVLKNHANGYPVLVSLVGDRYKAQHCFGAFLFASSVIRIEWYNFRLHKW